jgi:hypothetical protein
MTKLAIAALLAVISTEAQAIECSRTIDSKSYWSYRLIDGQRCWFRGHRQSKSNLHWPKREIRDAVYPIRAKAQDKDLDYCCWPNLTEFDKRFVGD